VKTTVIIIALVMLLKPAFPVVEYVVNYDYITTVLCVNKAKPQMHCNGKCHLMKELAKEAESEKPISSDKKGIAQEVEVLYCEVIPQWEPQLFSDCSTVERNTHYTNLYSHLDSHSVFHPPTFTA